MTHDELREMDPESAQIWREAHPRLAKRLDEELPTGLTAALFARKPDPVAQGITEAHRKTGEDRAKQAATRTHTKRPIQSWSLAYKPPRIREKRATPKINRPERHEPETMGVAPYHPPAGIN